MPFNEFIRKKKGDRPVLAICYDFDKTLTPIDMQAQGYIQKLGFDVPAFWKESNDVAARNEMDQNIAYMYKMLDESAGKLLFTKDTLAEYGAKVEFYPGVESWFERIRRFGEEHGVIVEHYVISSGLKEMIEGTSVAKSGAFEKIYASSFYFNDKGVAVWPAQAVNYTNKTQFLFRISKGVLDINDQGVNDYFSSEELRVPFRNMVYIGDSDTDIPCMKLVNSYGGFSIGVFDAHTQDKTKVYRMIRDNRIKYFAPADYTEDSKMDELIKAIIIRTADNEALEEYSYRCKAEAIANAKEIDDEKRAKLESIIDLENSRSFTNTHMVIKRMRAYSDWTREEIEQMLGIALANSQVRFILADADVAAFYRTLLEKANAQIRFADEVKALIDGNG
ncbi:MAG: haloacid dehalogenase-like hydrolase [Clostridia bacterium]|nr:haloacid dehalogenase-like hydrolase [Clostridia bacterium]